MTPSQTPPGTRARVRGHQLAIPSVLMRGGTSRGPFFARADLPDDDGTLARVLTAALGSPHPLQIDGLGGGHPLTSKAGIVGPSTESGADLDFRFAQLRPDDDSVDMDANCGNLLAAVVPFAVETGMIVPTADTTTVRVRTLNTGAVAEISVRTPGGGGARSVDYAGETRIDGAPGTSSPVTIGFLDTAGSIAGSLLPTGRPRDTVEVTGTGPVEVTCIDNGQPLVIVAATALGATGRESPAELTADPALRSRVEALRLACGTLMGLGDVTDRNYPKMTLISPPRHGGTVATRSFIPRVAHESIGVLAAVTAATACVLPGTVAHAMAAPTATGQAEATLSIEHPSGAFDVRLGWEPGDPARITRSALVRTARALMAGDLYVPLGLWNPSTKETNR
ncbi:4-oxalomesaconate tautomerase [Nocardiopsis sp. NRRL B-16309]|uniref:4-oxalomesaconate tautomerase n=1 Tax=Nocardiopsis sp. NRRL B-16309 TaxID=1519494 RepID=UPI0006AEDCD7|nr:4-oxalomesaconate tautomerase [Nocardiopsis sp. NRRL B-16309]KOX16288.1 PrpF protein [Nocardiopsis sp. NRRL B-16309]